MEQRWHATCSTWGSMKMENADGVLCFGIMFWFTVKPYVFIFRSWHACTFYYHGILWIVHILVGSQAYVYCVVRWLLSLLLEDFEIAARDIWTSSLSRVAYTCQISELSRMMCRGNTYEQSPVGCKPSFEATRKVMFFPKETHVSGYRGDVSDVIVLQPSR